ncbi:unnamed protein product [Cylicocyclus nassatus]|uniref:Calpain catalytic domain-containing protein n=1 Tax=Cylicocyclus nassatus TaxID=53992 RepID=A0AA36H3F3_CYLNA|nr:unnamed protein product [Cylicocyclus nassatus]
MSDDEYNEEEEYGDEGGDDQYGYDQDAEGGDGGYDGGDDDGYNGGDYRGYDYDQGDEGEQEEQEEPEPEEPEYDDYEEEPPEEPEEEPEAGYDEAEERGYLNQEDDEDEGPIVEEQAVAASTNAEEPGGGGGSGGAGFGSIVRGALDGFGGSNFGDIMGSISQIAGGQGGLTNIMSSGGMESMVERMIGSAAHRFLNINPETGAILGAIAGDIIFNLGGRGNSLTTIGKVVLENLISGKYRRDVHPFVPPVPTPGATTFGLNFEQERQKCLQNKTLFEDPEFPATDRSIYYKNAPDRDVEWKRPGQIVDDAQLIVGEKSRFDVKQGALGDCWLLAAVANLTLRDELFYRVVPPDQSFTDNYAGIFHFQFWRYGKWIDVVIDDRLPTVNGRLYYMHSQSHNVFWSALLEKAYAKLYGSYENLEGGTTAEALEDFTGGLTEFYNLRKTDKSTILAMMIRGFQMGSLFGCSIDADPHQKEAPLENGLVRGHAYSITALHTVQGPHGETPLIRIRNPWGNSKEWNGAWSDGSPEWNYIDSAKREELGVNFSNDGEFWMSFDDFYTNFMEMEVCNMSAAIMNEISEMTGVEVSEHQAHRWEEKAEDGEWSTQRGTAGGCANNPDSYARNPQFGTYFVVTEDSVEQDGKCTVIVAVLQKYRREMRTVGKDSLPIGFAVYPAESASQPASADYLLGRKPTARTKVFINMREVTCRFRVPAGNYIIVPCTFEPGCDGEFLLRIYVNGKLQASRLQ